MDSGHRYQHGGMLVPVAWSVAQLRAVVSRRGRR